MSGLTSDLTVGIQSLFASTDAMDVTTTNIANQNTPGYARRRVVLEEAAPVGTDGSTTGVDVQAIQSLRDNVLDLSVNAATSQQSQSSTVASSLASTQVLFSDTASGSIGTSMDAFFSSLQQLSTSPSDSSLRANTLIAAQNVAASFQSTTAAISSSQQQLDQNVTQDTASINTLVQQLATANKAISTAQNLGQSSSDAEDQRSTLLTQLATIVGYKTNNSSDGLTITMDNGTPLVVGSKAYPVTNKTNSNGFQDIYSGATDITSTIQGGTLGGYLQSRDQTLTGMKNTLDQFAFQFAKAVNTVQAAGSDASGTAVNGTANAAFFNPPNTTTGAAAGAAASISVALTGSSEIAASAVGGASGDNSNITNMIALQNQAVINGTTPTAAFANISLSIGNTISQATSDATATGTILTQLQNQQGSVEGVSLNEESSNLLLYQRSFQAAAKIITTVDTLMGNVLDMGATNPGY